VGLLKLRLTAYDEDGSSAFIDFELDVQVAPEFVASAVAAPSLALAWSLDHAGGVPMPMAMASLDLLAAWADPDGDGRTNLEEYALGTDPFTADEVSEAGRLTLTVDTDGGLRLSYRLRSGDPRLSSQVETATELGVWLPARGAAVVQRQPATDILDDVQVSIPAYDSDGPRYFRIRVDYW
jgi:hypothetical protein